MRPSAGGIIVIALVISMTLPAWGQNYYLYAPQSVTSAQKSQAQDGILVQEMEIQKGDSLYKISRKFSGHGMYYPQILLFNKIDNPNLIYPGTLLKVPVSHTEVIGAPPSEVKKKTKEPAKKQAAQTQAAPTGAPSSSSAAQSTSNTELSLSDLKKVGTSKSVARQSRKQRTSGQPQNTPRQQPAAVEAATLPPPEDDAQKLFEAAAKAYRRDDCRTALELLDRYLAVNSGSPLAADAALYKADCYLKLSAQ